MNSSRKYIAIDLKSFYASVECIERNLNALDTCLVVADASRTDKTICLAVSPALKAYGTGGRPRLFEVKQRINEVNANRGRKGKSYSAIQLAQDPQLAVDFIIAPPRMALYLDYSTRIYNIYLRYLSHDDIHIYSIDEVFIDATDYLDTYHVSAHDLAMHLIRSVLQETGITATVGIGTNLYLCKVAMDIVAKKMPPDKDGVRIAELDEISYRRNLWAHKPITDFWRVGRGIARRLAPWGIHTMGDIARASLTREDLLYKLFGINAELLIDHAWGWEPVTLPYVKAYRPDTHSISSGQVLHEPYPVRMARNVALEMADNVALKLFDQQLVTDQIVLSIGYDRESLTNPDIRKNYDGPIALDHYGRQVPLHSHGTINLDYPSSSSRVITSKVAQLFDRIANPILLVRRLSLSFNHLIDEAHSRSAPKVIQPDLFTDVEALKERIIREQRIDDKERRQQQAVLKIKKMFGKNAILRGLNYAEGATQKQRNQQIGGHHE